LNGNNIAYFTKTGRVEVNPHAEIPYSTIEQIRGILADTALNFIYSFDYRQIFTENELTIIHDNLSNLVMLPNNGLDFEAGQAVDNIIEKIETIVPELNAQDLSHELESEAELDEGVEP
jgi:hypothetical protein